MKIKKVLAGMMMCLAMASCIQDEALNVEAAIDGCRGKDIQQCLIDPNEFTIQLYVSKAADLSKINLLFELPAGATVAPEQKLQADGTDTYSFEESKTRNFKVTSEDGAFSTTYEVTLWQTEMPTTYGFETLSSLASTPYHVFYEEKDEEHILRRLEWASGNPGYQLTAQAKTPLDYPTVQVNGGMNGTKCVKLETKDTGSFGAMVEMYIAAGNLFIGSFEVGQALNDAMKATRFGFPYFYKPKSLKGYYKYKAGPQFSVKGEIVADRKDQCDIYGVLYETDDNVQFLDGSNSLDSKNIVALARDPDQLKETDEWTEFNFDFEPQNNKTIDSEKLEKGIYKLAIVFSSSVGGAKFEGAVGSTLYIDQVEIVNE